MSQTKAQLLDGKSATIQFTGGSASVPSVSFTGDTNTGIYSPGADQVAVSTGGSGRLFVDASGRVGVGTSSPSVKLEVSDVTSSNPEIRVVDGTVNTQWYASDTGVCIFGTFSNHPQVFRTNGIERLRIDASGRLLVGTSTSINNALEGGVQIVGTGADAYLTLTRFDTITSAPAGIILGRSKSGTKGTNTAVSDGDFLGVVEFTGADGGSSYRSAAQIGAYVDGAVSGGGAADMPGRLVFSTTADGASSPTERLRIDSSGRVGIGTTGPAALLDVYKGSGLGYVDSILLSNSFANGANQGIAWGSATNISGRIKGLDDGAYGTHLIFESRTGSGPSTTTSERARIDSSGRLLVGTSSTSATTGLLVQGSNGGSAAPGVIRACYTTATPANGDAFGYLVFSDSAHADAAWVAAERDGGTWSGTSKPTRLVFSTTADGASSPTERMRISSDGAISIANSPYLYPTNDNARSLGLNGFRWSAVWAANGTIQTSDKRAKVGITDSALGSDFIKSLRPVSYKWIEGGKIDSGKRDKDNNYIYKSVPGTRTHWGFIAQEVKEAVDAAGVDFGGWVLTDKDDPDSQQALRYDQFIAPLTKALQEALEKIETLEAKVAALESA